jgi:hypothetical protein
VTFADLTERHKDLSRVVEGTVQQLSVLRRVAVPAIAVALGSLALLGLLIGWTGASRAYSVGLHTLFRDHPASVVAVLFVTAIIAALLGRTLISAREVLLAIGFAVAADALAALMITLMIDEMRRFPMLPRAVLTETADGLQIVVIVIALTIGFVSRNLAQRLMAETNPSRGIDRH